MGTIIMDRNQPNKNIIKIRINQPIAPPPHQQPSSFILLSSHLTVFPLPEHSIEPHLYRSATNISAKKRQLCCWNISINVHIKISLF